MKQLFLTLALVSFLPIAALAHSPLKSSNPPDGAALTSIPEKIDFTFTKPARLIKVTLVQKSNGSTSKHKLAIPSRELTEMISVPTGIETAGHYEVQWRALSKDGHVIKNSFSFQVSGN